MKESTRLVVALIAGLIGGVAIAASKNAWLLSTAEAITPIGTLWINAIRMTIIPLVISLLITGVAGTADVYAIGRIGGRTLLTFFFLLLGTAIVIVPLAALVFSNVPNGISGIAGGQLLPPEAGGFGFYIVVYSVASLLVIALLYPAVAVAARVPMRTFAQAALPPQLVAFASSSSLASLPALIEAAERRLQLPEQVTGFVLPLAVSTFKIAAPVSWTIGALFVGWFYGVPLHAGQLAIVAFASIFLAAAAPGVPRGAFLMLAPLFLAIGLPVQGIGLLIALDAIPDLFATTLNVTGDLAATAIVAQPGARASMH